MTYTSLQRKTPLARGTSTLKRTAFKRSAPKPRKTTPPKIKDIPKPRITSTAVERMHMGRVAEIGCIACLNLGYRGSLAEIHHVRALAGAGQRSSNFHTIGLCPNHHRLGGSGVAFHAGKISFERNHGTELQLLGQVLRMLGFELEPDQIRRPDLGALLYPTTP